MVGGRDGTSLASARVVRPPAADKRLATVLTSAGAGGRPGRRSGLLPELPALQLPECLPKPQVSRSRPPCRRGMGGHSVTVCRARRGCGRRVTFNFGFHKREFVVAHFGEQVVDERRRLVRIAMDRRARRFPEEPRFEHRVRGPGLHFGTPAAVATR